MFGAEHFTISQHLGFFLQETPSSYQIGYLCEMVDKEIAHHIEDVSMARIRRWKDRLVDDALSKHSQATFQCIKNEEPS